MVNLCLAIGIVSINRSNCYPLGERALLFHGPRTATVKVVEAECCETYIRVSAISGSLMEIMIRNLRLSYDGAQLSGNSHMCSDCCTL